MARIADKQKMLDVKKTFINIIIRDGSTNASISKIAREANVSVGYMYRHYESKDSLVLDLFTERMVILSNLFKKHIEQNEKAEDAVFMLYLEVFNMLKDNENDFLFLLKMMIDYNVILDQEITNSLVEGLTQFREKYADELRGDINEEYIYMHIMGSFLFFINLRKRGVFCSDITKEEIKRVSEMAFNSLR